jgi:WD40 repeat protein
MNLQVLTGSRDASVRVWKIDCAAGGSPAATCTSTLLGHTHYVGTVGVAADGSVVSGSNDKHIIVWDNEAGTPAHILQGHADVVSCVRACPVRRASAGIPTRIRANAALAC